MHANFLLPGAASACPRLSLALAVPVLRPAAQFLRLLAVALLLPRAALVLRLLAAALVLRLLLLTVLLHRLLTVLVPRFLVTALDLDVDAGPDIVYNAGTADKTTTSSVLQSNDLGAERADGEDFVDPSWSQTGSASGNDITVSLANSGLTSTIDTATWTLNATEQMTLKTASDTLEVAYANAGNCSLERGDLDKAEVFLRQSLEFDESFATALLSMADVSYLKGLYLRARAFLQRYETVGTLNEDSLFLGYRIESKLGDTKTADRYRTDLL